MKIEVIRVMSAGDATIGKMYIDGIDTCYTLEDIVRPNGEKIYGHTAIPAGEYRVDITPSARFKRDLPILLDVPNFTGVRIHPGNTAEDTHGCILVGLEQQGASIIRSREAFATVFTKLRDALLDGEKVTIEIKSTD